jgi:hypothetical protein
MKVGCDDINVFDGNKHAISGFSACGSMR